MLTAPVDDGEGNYMVFETKEGTVVFQLLPEAAPQTVKTMRELAVSGFFDGCQFYRAEPNFVLQGFDYFFFSCLTFFRGL